MSPPPGRAFEDYLGAQPRDHQELLRDVRARIVRLVPAATDATSYGMPALTVNGSVLVWFASWKRHCSIYPVGPAFISAHPELAGYGHTDKGALHFTARQPLSDGVVADLVRERLASVAAEGGSPGPR
jgi:uncharacterized protein YdhG (YjbR/CyaY superfamily)